ncbi:MAG: preprotein translocase subunit SecE [Deltaproteobacteria bacterium]|nr:preprotein translocase subunit SecE [Deltaproteobacteria bacterium]TLN02512.1 MAG: preprotein translocase subunit SecE [bacterium]
MGSNPSWPAIFFLDYDYRKGLHVLAKTKSFLDEVKAELHRVTWPTRKETISTTWVVVFIVLLIAFYLGFCDVILARVMKVILS